MRIRFIISLIFAILVIIFGIQNSAVVSVKFFNLNLNISLALIILISTVIGAIIVALLGMKKEFALSRDNRKLTKEFENLQIQLETYKNENTTLKTEIEALKNKTLI